MRPALSILTALLALAGPAAADTITQLSLPANDLVYDASSGLIYASVPGRAGASGNSVTRFNPGTGEVVGSVFIGSEPGPLALTDDGQLLYVGLTGAQAVRRYQLASQSAGAQFPLEFPASRLATLPGDPLSIGVYGSGLGFKTLAVLNNGVPRTQTSIGSDLYLSDLMSSLSPARLYGVRLDELSRIYVKPDRFGSVDGFPPLLAGLPSMGNQFQRGLLFGSNGAVVDPEAGQLLGTFAEPGPIFSFPSVCPDLPGGRVFFLSRNAGDGMTIRAYDARNYTLIGSIAIPGSDTNFGSLVRWGTDGLAFRGDNTVYLVRTDLVSQNNATVDLRVAGSETSLTVPAGDPLTYTLTVTNPSEASATFATLTDTLPPNASLVSATASQGTVYQGGGVITARLGDLPAGATATVTVTARFATAGNTAHLASVTAFEADTDPSNDRFTGNVSVTSPQIAELSASWSAIRVTCPPRGKCHYTGKLVVRNTGGQEARKFVVRFVRSDDAIYDPNSAFDGKITEVKVKRLAPGKSMTVKFNARAFIGGGEHYVIAVVDADAAIPEANEGDNQAPTGALSRP